MKVKVIEVDPSTPFTIRPGRAYDIRWDAHSAVQALLGADPDCFNRRAVELEAEILERVARFTAKRTAELEKDAKDRTLTGEQYDKLIEAEMFRSRSPKRLMVEAGIDLVEKAEAVLKGIHDKRMARRLAHFKTCCRAYGCLKQPRVGNPALSGYKVRRRTFVFCKDHAGLRNLVSTRDYNRLKADGTLRVVRNWAPPLDPAAQQ